MVSPAKAGCTLEGLRNQCHDVECLPVGNPGQVLESQQSSVYLGRLKRLSSEVQGKTVAAAIE